jgi:glycosyltransferase involved in cell wall biosynthesis
MGKQLSWWFAEGPLLRHARHVLFTCEEEGILAQDAFWPYKVDGVSVGYGTTDVGGDPAAQKAAFRDAVPALAGRRYLLFLSRIHPKKGCDLLVEAFVGIAAGSPDLDLVIAGPDQVGLVAELKARAEALGIGARVHFPGMLKGDVKTGAFRGADAFVLTSHQENFGIVVAEAMACGIPVLISDKVNIWREVVADGAGMVEPDTLEGAKALLARFAVLGGEERAAMGARARESFLERFHVERAAEALMALIEQRLEEKRAA